jgi:hypothetical protein
MAKETIDYDSIIKNLRKDISNLRKEQKKIYISYGPKTKINKEYSVHVDDREGLIEALTSGMSYWVDNNHFFFYREETIEEFVQRKIEEQKKIEDANLKIKSIDDQITKIEEQIKFLKSEKNLKYQNPEYIEYLRLRSKFEKD